MSYIENTINKMNALFETDIKSFYTSLIDMTSAFDGEIYLVGGAVRDKLMGNNDPKDHDFVVTKIDLDDLAKLLAKFIPKSQINEVGKSFGIIKLNFNGEEYDFAIPRADVDRNTVKTDKNISIKDDLKRRDLVINAGAWNIKTEFAESNIISPDGYNCVEDIKNKIIRAVGTPKDRFREDSLRILRAISMSARFGFDIEPNTLQGIKENIDLLKSVSSERFYDEFLKGWTKGNADTQKFFKLLFDTNIGILLFGSDFKPIPLDKTESGLSSKEFFLAQYVAAFLHGGDFTTMNKKVDEQEYVKLAKAFDKGISLDNIKEISKHGDKFEFIKKVFGLIDSKTRGVMQSHLTKLLSKPLIPRQSSAKPLQTWELPLTGGEIMEVAKNNGKPITGKAVSDTVLKLIKAYQSGELQLADSDEANKSNIENYLKDKILNESDVKNNISLDIIRKRISNIYEN